MCYCYVVITFPHDEKNDLSMLFEEIEREIHYTLESIENFSSNIELKTISFFGDDTYFTSLDVFNCVYHCLNKNKTIQSVPSITIGYVQEII